MRKPWRPLSVLPRMRTDEFGRRTSGDLLGYLVDGTQQVVRLEYYPDDEPTWRMGLDNWDITKAMRAWRPLPHGAFEPNQAPARVKVLPLDGWMTCELRLADTLDSERYAPVAPRFKRPGRYQEGADCWFELPDGRAFAYPREDFLFQLKMLEAERISERQAEALAMIVAQRLATDKQREMLWAYRDRMAIRATGRSARKQMFSTLSRFAPLHDYYLILDVPGLHLVRVNRRATDGALVRALAEVERFAHVKAGQAALDWLVGGDEAGAAVEAERALFERAYAGENACKDFTLWEFSVAGHATRVRLPLAGSGHG